MKVLIPIDGSTCSTATLQWAAQALDREKTEYYLLYVVQTLPGVSQEVYEIEDANNFLKEGRELMKRYGCRVANAQYIVGEPPAAICSYADEIDADQILMGSHGRTGLPKLLLGSVSTAVMERSKRPVFIYRNVDKHGKKAQVLSGKGESHTH